MKICNYGCGQGAKYQFKNGKWCCSKNHSSCPEIRKKLSKTHKGQKHHLFGKTRSEKTKKKISITQKEKQGLTIKKIKERYPFFSHIEEMRYNPDKPGEKEVQVHCKNHNCPNSKEKGGWFIPTRNQLGERIRSIESPKGFGEDNFYCSQECKNQCPLYGLREDPNKDTKTQIPYTQEEYNIWRQKVLEQDNYTCQYCRDKATHTHHIKPVKTHPHLALDPDNGISFCKNCHYKIGHKTGTECSTGNLAKEQCNIKLGN